MSTLDELKYYCDEENTFGALLLTGQWGCGKTYLIEHQLCEDSDMKKKFVFLRISLFGEPSIESIQKKVKILYLFQKAGSKSKDIFKSISFLKKIIGIIKNTGALKAIGNAALSIDPTDFFEIKNEIGKPNVVLIFDDFERCTVNPVDLFGCINDYCENQGLKVDFSEKVGTQALQYGNIKEKLITRTIHYEPEYDQIIEGIVGAYTAQSTEYKEFLNKNRNRICNVFNKNEIKNLRSLKCAIQDFERVYQVFKRLNYIAKLDETFISFLAYVLMGKAGKIKTSSSLEELSTTAQARKDYPKIFGDKLLLNSVKDWALSGKWDPEELEREIKEKEEQEKPIKPEDKLKMSLLIDLDDETIHKGFEAYINEAYSGLLSLREYVRLIGNLSFARKIDYKFPNETNYEKLEAGINQCISNLNQNWNETLRIHPVIPEYDLKELSETELRLYTTIQNYCDKNIYMYESNKIKYLSALRDQDSEALFDCENFRFNVFDEEMATAVFEYYTAIKSCKRARFVYRFSNMWETTMRTPELLVEKTIGGMCSLLAKVNSLAHQSPLEKYVDNEFVTEIEKLISIIPKQQTAVYENQTE